MGGSQSSQTRTASFENNEPIGVIDVSDDVVQRLKQGIAKRGTFNCLFPQAKFYDYAI